MNCKELDLIRYNLGEFSDRSKIDLLADKDILYSTELSLIMAVSNHAKLKHINIDDYNEEYKRVFEILLIQRNQIIHGKNNLSDYAKDIRNIFEYIIKYIPYKEDSVNLLSLYQL